VVSRFLLVSLLLVGCVYKSKPVGGKPISESYARSIRVSETTREKVLEWFGEPQHIKSDGDQEVFTYRSGTQVKVFVFAPLPHAVWGLRTKEKVDTLKIFIDPTGVVSHYTYSKGEEWKVLREENEKGK
jgi:outer membrane protein assembly factor BamE (lipoprotein component of BamABCDE complex)